MTIARTYRCPHCGKTAAWEGNPFRPFCSERCRLTDLGNWAAENYRIPGEPVEQDDGDDRAAGAAAPKEES